jgi:hypothetical protein
VIAFCKRQLAIRQRGACSERPGQRFNTQVRRHDLKQALGIEQSLQSMLAHLAQRDAFG